MQSGTCRNLVSAAIMFICAGSLSAGRNVNAQNSPSPAGTATSQTPTYEEGRQTFESNCAGCHGLDGQGGERGPDISTRQQVVQLQDDDLRTILREGRPTAGMPPFATLGNARLDAVLAYLRYLQGKREAAAELPGDAAKGKSLFYGKARCADCHMVQGHGGFLGRDLSTYGVMSSQAIRSSMEIAGATTRMRYVRLRDSQEIRGLVRNEDNFSIQLQSLDGAFHLVSKADITAMEILPDSVMPSGYAKSLSDAEFDDLLKYLTNVAKSGTKASRPVPDDEE